ncbi:MAG: hypothetical protein AB1630_10770 [bacterium]
MNKKLLFSLLGLLFATIAHPSSYYGTWTLAGHPYVITEDSYVPSTLTLTIEPGVVVKFAANTSLTVYGTLNAVGTESGTITFTSLKDDIVGDTNGDEGATSPAAGDWKMIKFSGSNAKGTISYCDIGYAKSKMYQKIKEGLKGGG